MAVIEAIMSWRVRLDARLPMVARTLLVRLVLFKMSEEEVFRAKGPLASFAS